MREILPVSYKYVRTLKNRVVKNLDAAVDLARLVELCTFDSERTVSSGETAVDLVEKTLRAHPTWRDQGLLEAAVRVPLSIVNLPTVRLLLKKGATVTADALQSAQGRPDVLRRLQKARTPAGGQEGAPASSPATATGQARSCCAAASSHTRPVHAPTAANHGEGSEGESDGGESGGGGGGDGSGGSAAEEPSDAEETEAVAAQAAPGPAAAARGKKGGPAAADDAADVIDLTDGEQSGSKPHAGAEGSSSAAANSGGGGGGGVAASGEGGTKRPRGQKPHHILNPVNLRSNAPYITNVSQLPLHLAVLKQMMTAAESELTKSEDWTRNCADKEPRCWAVWLLRAVEEVKAVSDNKRRKALSDGVAQGGGYTRFAPSRHEKAVQAYNQRLPPGASPLTAIESLVHAIDAIDLGPKNSPNLDCSCKLLGGVAASCELLELEVNDRSALEERFEVKVGAEAKLVLALRQICLVALCVARAFFPEYEENDVRNAALVLIRHVCFGSEPAGTEARRACLADLLCLADLPAEAVNGFDVCLTKETYTSSGGKATISGKKRADICIFVKEASAVESVGQGTAAGTSRVKRPSGRAPAAPSAGCSVSFDAALGVYKTDEATPRYWTGDPSPHTAPNPLSLLCHLEADHQ